MVLPPDRYFNSHPHKEDDDKNGIISVTDNISTHILAGRMTPIIIMIASHHIFQLTSSQGG